VAKRILLLITDLEIGGTPTVVRELATRLRPYAHLEVICLKKWGPVADQLRECGVATTALGASRAWHLPGVVRRLRAIIVERKIDTLFSFLAHANTVASVALGGCPGVRGLQSIQTVQPAPRWHWRVQGWVSDRAEKFVVPSTAIVRVASERSGIAPERCIVIPNAVDPASYEQMSVFSGQVARVGYIGRLDPAKQPELLVEMMHFADESTELHYFGDGRARQSIERAARQTSARSRIVLHGTVGGDGVGPQAALARLDCLMLPSKVEGFGLVLIEAMAAGVPVIAVDAGGVRDVVTTGENGLLIPPGGDRATAELFARALATLRSDAALRDRLIAGGLKTVHDKFSWDRVLPQYRALLGV